MQNDATRQVDGGATVKRRVLVGTSAGVALALALTAGVAIPIVMQAQRVSAYHELTAQHGAALSDRSEAEVRLEASIALHDAQRAEAYSLAERAVALGGLTEPSLTQEAATAISEAGAAALEALGAATADDERRASASARLVEATDALLASDAAAAETADATPPEPSAPHSYLLMSVDEAAGIIDTAPAQPSAEILPDEAVTDEAVEAAELELETVREEVTTLSAAIRDESSGMADVAAALASTRAALLVAAAEAPTQAVTVVEQTGKAPDLADAVAASAQEVQDLQETDDVALLLDRLEVYTAAAHTAQSQHDEAVEAERVAAERAAAAEREAAAAREAAASRGSSGGGGGGGGGSSGGGSIPPPPMLCNRWMPDLWGGGGSLVLVPC